MGKALKRLLGKILDKKLDSGSDSLLKILWGLVNQGRRKVEKFEGARSNTRLFDGTGLTLIGAGFFGS